MHHLIVHWRVSIIKLFTPTSINKKKLDTLLLTNLFTFFPLKKIWFSFVTVYIVNSEFQLDLLFQKRLLLHDISHTLSELFLCQEEKKERFSVFVLLVKKMLFSTKKIDSTFKVYLIILQKWVAIETFIDVDINLRFAMK